MVRMNVKDDHNFNFTEEVMCKAIIVPQITSQNDKTMRHTQIGHARY